MSVSLSIALDTRRLKKKTGTYPVKLMIVHDSAPQRYQTIYHLTEDDYKKLSAPRITPTLQKIRDDLKDIIRSAEIAAKEIQPFSFREFEKHFITPNPLFKESR